jgi:hypothetical protein
VSFLISRCQDLHRRFIGVQHRLGDQDIPLHIDKGLQDAPGAAHPVGQRGTGNEKPCTGKYVFLEK